MAESLLGRVGAARAADALERSRRLDRKRVFPHFARHTGAAAVAVEPAGRARNDRFVNGALGWLRSGARARLFANVARGLVYAILYSATYIFGLGGRDFYAQDARLVFEKMANDDYSARARFIGLLERGDEDERA